MESTKRMGMRRGGRGGGGKEDGEGEREGWLQQGENMRDRGTLFLRQSNFMAD